MPPDVCPTDPCTQPRCSALSRVSRKSRPAEASSQLVPDGPRVRFLSFLPWLYLCCEFVFLDFALGTKEAKLNACEMSLSWES